MMEKLLKNGRTHLYVSIGIHGILPTTLNYGFVNKFLCSSLCLVTWDMPKQCRSLQKSLENS